MAVPKKKTSYSRKNQRDANKARVASNILSTNGVKRLGHRIDATGFYKGKNYNKPEKVENTEA